MGEHQRGVYFIVKVFKPSPILDDDGRDAGVDGPLIPSSRHRSGLRRCWRHREVSIVGPSGRLGTYTVRHALDRGHEVVAVCRPRHAADRRRRADGRSRTARGQADTALPA
jgi:hypothetical protein